MRGNSLSTWRSHLTDAQRQAILKEFERRQNVENAMHWPKRISYGCAPHYWEISSVVCWPPLCHISTLIQAPSLVDSGQGTSCRYLNLLWKRCQEQFPTVNGDLLPTLPFRSSSSANDHTWRIYSKQHYQCSRALHCTRSEFRVLSRQDNAEYCAALQR